MVAPGIYLGNASHARNLQLLEQLQITHVLNCASQTETETGPAYYARHANFEYFELGATDDEITELVAPYLRQVVSFVDSALLQRSSVLIHCVKGVNRSPALCVAYMMKRLRKPLLNAVMEVWEQRPLVLRNASFCRELAVFGRQENLLEAPSLQSAPVTSNFAGGRGRPTLEDLMG